jgi:hypothetical protein
VPACRRTLRRGDANHSTHPVTPPVVVCIAVVAEMVCSSVAVACTWRLRAAIQVAAADSGSNVSGENGFANAPALTLPTPRVSAAVGTR